MRSAVYVRRRLVAAARWMLLAVALVVQFGSNAALLVGTTPMSPVELGGYVALGIVGAGAAAALTLRRSIPRWYAAGGCVVLLACAGALSADLPPEGALRAGHWSLGLIGWYGLVLLFGLPPRWAGLLLGAVGVLYTVPVVAENPTTTGLANLGVGLGSVLGLQFAVALGSHLLAGIARRAQATADEEQQVRIEEETAAAVAANHERRYADLREATIPLLRGLADGELDPRDPVVRRRCAVEAARMRRLFAEHADSGDRLVHELGGIIDVAERHGVSVHLTVRGAPTALPDNVRAGLLGPISEALVTADGDAKVTVLHAPDHVRVAVRCDAPGLQLPRDGSGEVEVVESTSGGQLWLETSWQSR